MRQKYLAECPPILREYLGYIEVVKGRSPKTADKYFIVLRSFLRYIQRQRNPLLPTDAPIQDVTIDLLRTVTLTDVYEYLNHEKTISGNANATIARKIVSLRTFFRYLTDYKHDLEHNPIQNLETPKLKKALPKYLTLEQSRELLDGAGGSFATRDYCMLLLFLSCGLRREELASLNFSSIGRDRMLRVVGKGNKERILYLNDACIAAIEAYMPARAALLEKGKSTDRDALFLSRLGRRISVDGIHYIIKQYLRRIPGAEGMSTHKLRHTAATLMYQESGVDIRTLQTILGHANLGTTEIYTHLADRQVQMAMENSPLADRQPPKEKNEPDK